MDGRSDAPVAASRQLTLRELATIKAALRLWLETPAAAIPRICYAEADGALILDDLQIEPFLVELAGAGDVVLTALVNPEALDRRRV